MLAQWTGEIVCAMHLNGIKHKDLAKQVGWHPKYLSAVLNGHKTPKGAQQKLKDAIDALVIQQS